jgi:hypothetical protein
MYGSAVSVYYRLLITTPHSSSTVSPTELSRHRSTV